MRRLLCGFLVVLSLVWPLVLMTNATETSAGYASTDSPPVVKVEDVEKCRNVDQGASDKRCSDEVGALADNLEERACIRESEPEIVWPEHYKAIKRVKFTGIEDIIQLMKKQSEQSYSIPLIIEGTNTIDWKKWEDISYLRSLLQEKKVLVKRSKSQKFRYYDRKKNIGKFEFSAPVVEEEMNLAQFEKETEKLLRECQPSRLYLQETLSGHDEMSKEFVSWQWELLIRISSACGWGLPDSNELFVGMQGVETPLHFDERENLFFQVRGRKDIATFPFIDYTKLYPFPTTHPCDRQSMVGSAREPDLEAFPRFKEVVGHYATLQAGDLLYLPYGWWHWLRNMDHMAMSISFWSTTPPNDLSGGVPETFSDHMLTRVRRNLETMVAQQYGPESHNETMVAIRDAVMKKNESDPRLKQVRQLLGAVRMLPEKQDTFILEMIDGRFGDGFDWNRFVEG